MNVARGLALVCALVAVAGLAAEGAPEGGAGAFRVKHWTSDDGLPQNRIQCLKQTPDGYLWIGTWHGLVRFDGVHFTALGRRGAPALKRATITALAEDQDGTLWIGTRDGVVSYRARRFGQLGVADGLPDPEVWQLAGAQGGGFWFQAGDFFGSFDDRGFSRPFRIEFPGRILSLHEGGEGGLNVFTVNGCVSFSRQTGQMRTNYLVQPGAPGWLAAWPAGQSGRFWVGTEAGLRRLEPEGLRPVSGLAHGSSSGAHAALAGASPGRTTSEPGTGGVDFLYQDRASNLWMNVRHGGLYYWNGASCHVVDLGESLSRTSILCMEEDLEGNLWLGTELGLAQLHPLPIRTYTVRDGLPADSVLSVCEGADGSVWAGTDAGVSCIREDRVVGVTAKEPVMDAQDRSVWPCPEGGVWVSKRDVGVFKCWPSRFGKQIGAKSLPGSVNTLYGDSKGRLWLGTEGGAVAYQMGEWSSPCASLISSAVGDVRCILEDRQGTFWFGTMTQGLVHAQGGALRSFTQREGLSHNSVWSLLEDGQGTLWIATDNGFNRYREGKIFAFGRQEGLPEETINCVLQDDAGYLWLGGLEGIHRVDPAELNAVAEARAERAQFVTLGVADGMESSETNGGENQPAGWKARDGRLWFPTIRGLVVVDPKAVPLKESLAPAVIEQVKADDEIVFGGEGRVVVRRPKARDQESTVQIPQSRSHSPKSRDNGSGNADHGPRTKGSEISTLYPRLKAGQGHVLEFQYTANSFVAPERVRFRYQLVGADTGWREETLERTARYFNLKPGKYRFEVLAANHHKVWSGQPAAFPFSLAPHFWQTWTFYLLCGAAVLGAVGALEAYRLGWRRRLLRLEEQRTLANERTRIARDLHDDLGTALTGLALELDVVRREARQARPVADRLSKTAQRTRELAERMREVVWTVNPKCDTVSSLASFLEQQVGQFLQVDGLRVRLDFPESIPELPLDAEARHQLALSVREALTNVVRHAQATEVTLSLKLAGNGDGPSTNPAELSGAGGRTLVLQVKDNGRGFEPLAQPAHGLANMRSRLEQVGGSCELVSAPGTGTTLLFRLPLPGASTPEGQT
jgi:ligand-binding sensor domain-containing protein/signal transduction histidine kinase